jgi:predicted AlkP superfamily phosphohydrolase/phosphomutase
MMVEMGVDRIHHAFWSYMDATHKKYEAGNPFEQAIGDYYSYVDHKVGEVLELFPDDTVVLIVSDHGAKKLNGAICFNEWLINQGYLVLKSYPDKLTSIDKVDIDWSKTKAWGDGGYYGRLFLNVRGREPNGIVEQADYEKIRAELIEKIEAINDPEGNNIGSAAFRPEELYRELNGVPPDLMVYFGDLDWRSVGSVGYQSIYTFDNDTGPDEANHDWNGVYICSDSIGISKESTREVSLLSIAAETLSKFGLPSPQVPN